MHIVLRGVRHDLSIRICKESQWVGCNSCFQTTIELRCRLDEEDRNGGMDLIVPLLFYLGLNIQSHYPAIVLDEASRSTSVFTPTIRKSKRDELYKGPRGRACLAEQSCSGRNRTLRLFQGWLCGTKWGMKIARLWQVWLIFQSLADVLPLCQLLDQVRSDVNIQANAFW
jgi:hypothetical protein